MKSLLENRRALKKSTGRGKHLRIAFIHDWLFHIRGGERCLEVLCKMFPEADIYTIFYKKSGVTDIIRSRKVCSSLLSRLPGVYNFYRYLFPFYFLGLRSLEKKLHKNHSENPYDLVVSVSHCVAKNIVVPRGVPHICYCLTPVRYLWDQYESYFGGRMIEPFVRLLRPWLRRADLRGADGVSQFIAISEFVRLRIERLYKREALVVYPPVDTNFFTPTTTRQITPQARKGFLCVSALVPYKNVHLIIQAFNKLQMPLTVIGDGPESAALREISKENITFLSKISDDELRLLYQNSKALIFAAEEDFGIAPVESLSVGTPVICYGKGGALETVNAGSNNRTGVYFTSLSVESICQAVEEFLLHESDFTKESCRRQAEKFSESEFCEGFFSALRHAGVKLQEDSVIHA